MNEELYGIGHNAPPLEELLPEETKDLRQRALDLIAMADKLVVSDEKTAGDASTLAKLIRDHAKEVDDKREERKAPFLKDGRTVDTHFNAIRHPLIGSDPKVRGGKFKEVSDKFEAYQAEKERIAAAERRRLEDLARQERARALEAERQQRLAEEAAVRAQAEADRRVREAQEAAQKSHDLAAQAEAKRLAHEVDQIRLRNESAAREAQLEAELAATKANDRADDLEKMAIEAVATQVVSSLGVKAVRRTVKEPVITDFKVALAHAVKIDRTSIEETVLTIYKRQILAKVDSLPGAEIRESKATSFRG